MRKFASKFRKVTKKFIGKCKVVIQDKYLEEKAKYQKDPFKYKFWLSVHLIVAILSIILLPKLTMLGAIILYFVCLRLSS